MIRAATRDRTPPTHCIRLLYLPASAMGAQVSSVNPDCYHLYPSIYVQVIRVRGYAEMIDWGCPLSV